MSANRLLARIHETGAVLTPRLDVDAPAGAISAELRAEMTTHKNEILVALLGPEGLDAARRLHKLYFAACFELAETLGWPDLKLAPPTTVGGCEYLWRLYLKKASVLELREQVLPKLQGMIAAMPPPGGAAAL